MIRRLASYAVPSPKKKIGIFYSKREEGQGGGGISSESSLECL